MANVTTADTDKLKTLLNELQSNPMRGDVILSENREFLARMVQATRDAHMVMPARFNSIVARLGM